MSKAHSKQEAKGVSSASGLWRTFNHVANNSQDGFVLISNPFACLPQGSRGSRLLQLLNWQQCCQFSKRNVSYRSSSSSWRWSVLFCLCHSHTANPEVKSLRVNKRFQSFLEGNQILHINGPHRTSRLFLKVLYKKKYLSDQREKPLVVYLKVLSPSGHFMVAGLS